MSPHQRHPKCSLGGSGWPTSTILQAYYGILLSAAPATPPTKLSSTKDDIAKPPRSSHWCPLMVESGHHRLFRSTTNGRRGGVRRPIANSFEHSIGNGQLACIRQLGAMLSHAVTDTPATRLDGPAQCFQVVSAGFVKRAWFSRCKAGKKGNERDSKYGLREHGFCLHKDCGHHRFRSLSIGSSGN